MIQPEHHRHPLHSAYDCDSFVGALMQRAGAAGVSAAVLAGAEVIAHSRALRLVQLGTGDAYVLERPLAHGDGVEIIGVESSSVRSWNRWAFPIEPDASQSVDPETGVTTVDYRGGGVGTTLIYGQPVRAGHFHVAGISTALDAPPCGDGWAAHEHDGVLTLVVVDGLGHGPRAAEGAAAALSALDVDGFQDAAAFFTAANAATKGTRGCVASWCRIDTAQSSISFSGIGNVDGRVFLADRSHGLISTPGTVGIQWRQSLPTPITMPWEIGASLVLHTDGLQVPVDPRLAALAAKVQPLALATMLHRDYARADDDTTIVVVRDARPSS